MKTLLSLLLTGLLLQSLHAQEWPRIFKPGAAQSIYQDLGEKDGLFHYRTKHYRIESDQVLRPTLLADFARSAESVALILERIPLALSSPPKKELPRIRIFRDEEDFLNAGGAKGAAGFYDGRRQEVLILWSQFFPETGSRMGPRANFSLLVHELVHLQMHGLLWRTRPWFYEGVAEYLAAAHEKGGVFHFTKIEGKIRDRIKQHTDPAATGTPVMNLSELVKLDSKAWHELAETKESWELLETYSSALLLIHYFFNGGDARRTELTQFLEAVDQIKDSREKKPRLVEAAQAIEIQKRLGKYWSPRGLKLQFK